MDLVGLLIVAVSGMTYKRRMSNRIRLCSERRPSQPAVPRKVRASVNPIHLVWLALVLTAGTGILASWLCEDFSLEHRAIRGDAKAQYLLGKRYFDDALSQRDYAEAALWIGKAAAQGDVKAQTGMGLLYEHGLGVPKNYGEALKWLRRAAAQGFAVAQNEIGVMYAKGRGVSRNLDQAAEWCRLAAEQGSEIARKNFELAEIAKSKVIPEITTPDKRCYKRVVLQKVEPDGVMVSFLPFPRGLGWAKLRLESLPAELQELCGYAAKEGTASAYSQVGPVAATL